MRSDLLLRDWQRRLPVVALLGLAVLPLVLIPMGPVAAPWNGNNAQLSVVSLAAIFGTVAVATAMFAYMTGLPSIAQSGLWGLGAYAAAVSLHHIHMSFWLSFPFAIVIPVVVGWPAAAVSLRTRGTAFLIVTLAFSEFVVLVLDNIPSVTGGFSGIEYDGDPTSIGPLKFHTATTQYYLFLFVLGVAMGVYWLVRRSNFGRRVQAIRDNTELARSLSINAYLHRVVVFEISAAVTGLAGPLILIQQRVITPDLFNTTEFLSVYLMIMLGGIATIAGPAAGAWVVELLPQWIGSFASISPNAQQLIYGVLLIFFVLLARKGVIGQTSIVYHWLVDRRTAPTPRIAQPRGGEVPAGAGQERPARRVALGGPVGDLASHELSPDVVLDVRGLSHNFGANRAVDNLSFEVRAGEIRGMIGPNGSGKTTTLNCISGFLRPSAGDIHFRSLSIAGRHFDKVSSRGLVRTFQQPEVFASFTPRQTCDMVLTSVGALGGGREFNDGLPADPDYYLDLCSLTEVADEPSIGLPYGHTRLLGVAAALSRRPYLLMLDEPAAGLGQSDRDRLADVIQRARDAGVSIVIVDHDMSFLLPLCHRLTVLDYGKKICEGDPRTVCANAEVIAAYLGTGFAKKHTATTTPEATA